MLNSSGDGILIPSPLFLYFGYLVSTVEIAFTFMNFGFDVEKYLLDIPG